jgi:beta-aspartyl-dipeptidase (metallo-type)
LLEEAIELARAGAVVDITAFPVADGEDAWSAEEALVRFLDAGAPPERVTVSSDAGGCLPVFDAQGRVTAMDVGRPGALLHALRAATMAGMPLGTALPAFTLNPAEHWGLQRKGRIEVGSDADLVVLNGDGAAAEVMAGGRWHVRGGVPTVRGPLEQAE